MASVITSIELPNGVKLPYVEQGDPSGVPVLLLHGWTDSWHSYEPVLPHLPASIHAFALTQRGHGDADRPAEGYRPKDFAADVAAFMDAFELEQAVIVGHSMGSHIAQRFAQDYPERVLGVVLLGAFLSLRDNPLIEQFWDEVISTLTDPVDPDFVRAFQVDNVATQVSPGIIDTAVSESLKVPARVWKEILRQLIDEDHTDRLGMINAPTLIIWGDQDAFSPRSDQDGLLARIPKSRLVVYAGSGHAFHWEEPGRTAADIVDFIEYVAGQRA